MNPNRLHIMIDRPGDPIRLGPDEADPGRIPSPPDFGDTMPGGFADASFSISGQVPVERGQGARILGAGSRVAWEGRISQINPTANRGMEFQCEGWKAHLNDDRISEIYAHRAYGDWMGATVARRQVNDAAGTDTLDASPDWDQTSPALKSSFTGPWTRNTTAEAWFDAGAARIIKVWVAVNANAAVGATGGAWAPTVLGCNDDAGGGSIHAGGLTRNGAGIYWDLPSIRRFMALQHLYLGAGGASREYEMFWRIVLYGNHGLPLQKVEGTDPMGVAGSDAVAHALGKAAPLIRFTTGPGGSIEPSTYIPPHLSFVPAVNPEEIVTHVAALGGASGKLLDWGVFENKTFFMRTPGTYGREWRVRIGEGASLTEQGDSFATTYNGIVSVFTDHSGKTWTIGPPGSGCDIENSLLLDTSPTNPVNRAGIPRKLPTEPIDLGVVDPTIALRLSQVALVELSKPMSKGEIQLDGPVKDAMGVAHPTWAPRSGDRIIAENEQFPRLRTIVDKRYSHASGQATVSTDSPPNRLDAVIGRLRAGADRALG